MQTTTRKQIACFGLSFVFFVTLWSLLVLHLSANWSINPQYSFGWLVPLLGLYLVWTKFSTEPPASADIPKKRIAHLLICAAALLFLPVWLIEQPNPDWIVVSWLFAGLVIVASLSAVYLLGGRAHVAYFAFPFCFILTAIPWPHRLETGVVQGLMHVVAAITVELLNLFSIPAIRHGSVIEIRNGLLGIDDACSGVRSLQASIMICLFLGELCRMSVVRRFVLLAIGLGVAFLCNIARAFLLAWIAAHENVDALHRWHDPAGYTIATICFLAVGATCAFLKPKQPLVQQSKPAPAFSSFSFAPKLATGLVAWILLVLAGTEAWFRSHEIQRDNEAAAPGWSVSWPRQSSNFSAIPIPPTSQEMLLYDQGDGATWITPEGTHWVGYFFTWRSGPTRSRILARMHSPEVCMPAEGYKLKNTIGMLEIPAAGFSLPMREYLFELGGQPVYVFYCIWENPKANAAPLRNWDDYHAGLRSVALGERSLGQQTLEIVITGPNSAAEAEAELRRGIAKLVQRTNP